MSTNTSNSMRQMIYSNLQMKDTEELLEIWTQNDREAWTDEAFDVIRELLLERTGSLPEQNQPVKVDKYHNPEILIKIANWSKTFSWVILLLSFLFMFWTITALTERGISLSLPIGISEVIGGFFSFIILQAIAELIFLLMDIERNTRRKKSVG